MIYYCCANNTNIGDYFSMLGVRELVNMPGKEIYMAGNPKQFDSEISRLKKDDILIIGGGGLLKDHFSKYWEIILNYKKKNNFTFILFGIGVCDLKGQKTIINSNLLQDIMDNSKSLFIRPDIPEILRVKAVETFCPSNYYFSKFKKNISENNYILYIDHEKLIGKENNNKIKNKIINYCNLNNKKYINISNNELNNIYDIYNNAEFIFSTRLHGLILGHAVEKRVIAISNDYKIEGYSKKILSNNIYDLNKFLELDIVSCINNYSKPLVSSEEINKDLLQKVKQIKDLIWQIGGKIVV